MATKMLNIVFMQLLGTGHRKVIYWTCYGYISFIPPLGIQYVFLPFTLGKVVKQVLTLKTNKKPP